MISHRANLQLVPKLRTVEYMGRPIYFKKQARAMTLGVIPIALIPR